MAQSIHDKQHNLESVVNEVTTKSESELTKEDASKVMSAEVCVCCAILPASAPNSH